MDVVSKRGCGRTSARLLTILTRYVPSQPSLNEPPSECNFLHTSSVFCNICTAASTMPSTLNRRGRRRLSTRSTVAISCESCFTRCLTPTRSREPRPRSIMRAACMPPRSPTTCLRTSSAFNSLLRSCPRNQLGLETRSLSETTHLRLEVALLLLHKEVGHTPQCTIRGPPFASTCFYIPG